MTVTDLSYALNTFYLLVSAALVMWMAAGFAMLEAGLVRSKNTTEILVKNILLYAIACLCYLLVGYTLMYGSPDVTDFAPQANFFFQVVFVATAMSIVSGAVAERMKLTSFLLFAVVMTSFIYPIQGSWSWGGGFLANAGFIDFAGSGIVHLAGAAAALAGVLLLGPRKGKYGHSGNIYAIPGANMPLAALGTLILWLGWFGFNGGSQLSIVGQNNSSAVAQIFVNTNTAAAAGALAAFLLVRIIWRKSDLTMILNGALAGLVAITAEPSASSAITASLIGLGAGVLVVVAIIGLDRAHIDDPVGAISVHGVCGIYGLLMVSMTHPEATLLTQLYGIAVIFVWVFSLSLLIWWLLRVTMGTRISAEHEYSGADIADCGVEAYPEFVYGKTK
ncbi:MULTISPECIES: ammonium transporter [Idiomarina]|uniref:ammonium transporter n=1 Tax=Idiomarina TaxID=135575 RepID=UPI00129AC796|nr:MULTISPECIES: ammonium transporter [Idiomarina]MRJ41611.1 ammonium transporter [Idiomarina sp. FeN1]NCU57601.1 ammonium transporter [Idiomarina sp. FenA--70]NCU60153.1 ammonium transporter [Idiomarina sp. FenBw--71]UUN13756.1 ammonium transporter [Idiomarina loihiensis]